MVGHYKLYDPQKLDTMELPETGDVSARLLAGILSAINEQDGVPPSSVQPLEYANNYTSKLLHIENDELKARICALEAHVMELEAQGQFFFAC